MRPSHIKSWIGIMPQMNVVVAGLGWWGKVLANSLARSPRFKIAYVVDPKPPEGADAFARERGFEIKPDFDAMLDEFYGAFSDGEYLHRGDLVLSSEAGKA